MYNMLRPCTYIQNENVQKSSSYFPFSPKVPELKVLRFGWDKVYISMKTYENILTYVGLSIVIELMKILS